MASTEQHAVGRYIIITIKLLRGCFKNICSVYVAAAENRKSNLSPFKTCNTRDFNSMVDTEFEEVCQVEASL